MPLVVVVCTLFNALCNDGRLFAVAETQSTSCAVASVEGRGAGGISRGAGRAPTSSSPSARDVATLRHALERQPVVWAGQPVPEALLAADAGAAPADDASGME